MKPSSTHRKKPNNTNETRSSRMISYVKSFFDRKPKPNQTVPIGQKKSKSPKIDKIGLEIDEIGFEIKNPSPTSEEKQPTTPTIKKKPAHKISMSNEIQRIQRKIKEIAEEIEKNNEFITKSKLRIENAKKITCKPEKYDQDLIASFEQAIRINNNNIKTRNQEIEFYNKEKQELENSLNEAIKELEKNLKDGGKKRKGSKTKKMKLNRK